MGWEVGVGRDPKAIEKQPLCAHGSDIVYFSGREAVESSFTLSVALLVHPSGTVHPTVDCHASNGFTRSQR